ncbi:MAG: SDR family NAD(P)-dependent oxidoreductase [Ginsengibacter sp.]
MANDSKKILGKTIIITGVAGNLGQAVAKKFNNEGYNVIGTIHTQSSVEHSINNSFEEVHLDLLNEEDSLNFVTDVVARFEKIDIAVLTAGGFTKGDIDAAKTEDLYKQYQLNFETAYNVVRPVFMQMKKQNSGRIFLIGSRQGLDASIGKGTIAYSLSKSLLFRLAEIMNAEMKGKNVVTNIIVPGTIDTPQNRASMPESDFGSWVTPDQIADVIFFYSGEEADVLREPVIKVYNKA